MILSCNDRIRVSARGQVLLLLFDLLRLPDFRTSIGSEDDDARRLQEPCRSNWDPLDFWGRAEEEALALRRPDEGWDALNVLALDARSLEHLPTQVRQRMDGQITEVCQADEAVFRIVWLRLGLEICEADFSDPWTLVCSQFVLAARLQRRENEQLELLFRSDQHPVWKASKIFLIVAANVLNWAAVIVDHLDVYDRSFVLQLNFFCEHRGHFFRISFLCSANRNVQ